MNLSFISNDTIAIVFLGCIALAGTVTKSEVIVASALGAISGYIGSKTLSE